MVAEPAMHLVRKLEGLRTELVDLAFELERTGRAEAADVAIRISARVHELGAEIATEQKSEKIPGGSVAVS